MNKQYKNIISTTMAKYLIRQKSLGRYLVDIRPHKEDRKRSIFVFELNDEVSKAMSEYYTGIELGGGKL